MYKRVFLIILDSFGIGNAPDAKDFGDEGSNTLASIAKSKELSTPTLKALGLFNIDGVNCASETDRPKALYGRMVENSMGKDTTIGHWEIAGVESAKPLPTFPNGFPQSLIDEFSKRCRRGVLCNRPYSGTDVLRDYGEKHLKTGELIVYTSADSVFQIAAHENIVPVSELYKYCDIAREMLQGELGVGRIIARPFVGDSAESFKRTSNRHDVSLPPPAKTMLDYISESGKSVIGVGKIYDIFAGAGITEKIKTTSNLDGMNATIKLSQRKFNGLAFINLVDFDMLYGHRNDVNGYAKALSEFDLKLADLMPNLNSDDLLIISADHGCDPGTKSTDHSRECVPLLIYNERLYGKNLGTINGFGSIAATVCSALGIKANLAGKPLIKQDEQ